MQTPFYFNEQTIVDGLDPIFLNDDWVEEADHEAPVTLHSFEQDADVPAVIFSGGDEEIYDEEQEVRSLADESYDN